MSGRRHKSGATNLCIASTGPEGNAGGAFPQRRSQPLMLAALIRSPAIRGCPRSWGRSTRRRFQPDHISGTRMYGSRSRRVLPRASTAACDSAGMSGSAAARWRKYARKIPVGIRAWRIAFVWQRRRTRDDRNCKRGDGRIEECILRHPPRWSKTLTLEILFVTVKTPGGEPRHCNSNAGYLTFATGNAVTA
jgi:hypothetical protein